MSINIQPHPLILAGIATLTWGGWAVCSKVASRSLPVEWIVLATYAVGTGVGALFVIVSRPPEPPTVIGLVYAALGGVLFAIGGIAYYAALQRGSTAITTTIAALYFVVAAILAVIFLNESLGLKEMAGIVLAVFAAVLLTS